jgi:hypothetical protein
VLSISNARLLQYVQAGHLPARDFIRNASAGFFSGLPSIEASEQAADRMRSPYWQLSFSSALVLCVAAAEGAPRHFAANENFDTAGVFAPARAGFDLADIDKRAELDRLPDGVLGLMWIGQCHGVDAAFENKARAVIDHPKLFGFYLVDDADPTGRWAPRCDVQSLRAEADWIHGHRLDAVAFMVPMNLSSSEAPAFSSEYAPEKSHVDLFGVPVYPCRTQWQRCDFDMIDRFVAALVAVGVPNARIVPMYQAFGGGAWLSDSGGAYRLPTPSEMQTQLDRWSRAVPTSAFDFAYSWGSQRGDEALASAPQLQQIIERHNR